MAPSKNTKKTAKTASKKVTVDCKAPVEDKVIDVASFEKFLKDKIKVNNKCPAPAGAVDITRTPDSLKVVFMNENASKRYIKYLTKKYLKKQQLKDYLRVIAAGKNGYKIVYYKHQTNDEADEEEDE